MTHMLSGSHTIAHSACHHWQSLGIGGFSDKQQNCTEPFWQNKALRCTLNTLLITCSLIHLHCSKQNTPSASTKAFTLVAAYGRHTPTVCPKSRTDETGSRQTEVRIRDHEIRLTMVKLVVHNDPTMHSAVPDTRTSLHQTSHLNGAWICATTIHQSVTCKGRGSAAVLTHKKWIFEPTGHIQSLNLPSLPILCNPSVEMSTMQTVYPTLANKPVFSKPEMRVTLQKGSLSHCRGTARPASYTGANRQRKLCPVCLLLRWNNQLTHQPWFYPQIEWLRFPPR